MITLSERDVAVLIKVLGKDGEMWYDLNLAEDEFTRCALMIKLYTLTGDKVGLKWAKERLATKQEEAIRDAEANGDLPQVFIP